MSCPYGLGLEVETQFRRLGAGRDVVRAAKSRKEIIQSHSVRQIDDRKAEAPSVPIPAKQVVLAHGEIKQIARLNSLRSVVVILRSRRRYFQQSGRELGCRAGKGQRPCRSRGHAIAGEPRLEFLIGGEGQSGDGVKHAYRSYRNCSRGLQAAVGNGR